MQKPPEASPNLELQDLATINMTLTIYEDSMEIETEFLKHVPIAAPDCMYAVTRTVWNLHSTPANPENAVVISDLTL